MVVLEKEVNKAKYEDLRNKERIVKVPNVMSLNTNELLIRLIKQKDDLIERNLEKGISRHEMGIGITDQISVQTKSTAKKLVNFLKQIGGLFAEEIEDFKIVASDINHSLNKIKKKSENFMRSYVDVFEEKTDELEDLVENALKHKY